MPDNNDPTRLVQARRLEGFGTVSWSPSGDFGDAANDRELWEEGTVIPMRWQEANDRIDCEIVGEWPPEILPEPEPEQEKEPE